MLLGRLGLETARIPHVDRYGLLWLEYGKLYVENGTLRFIAAKSRHMDAGSYSIPFQTISLILLGPGTSITHDVFRLAASHGCALVAVGEDGIKMYSAPPWGTNESILARKQTTLWAEEDWRILVARSMYALRLGELFPTNSISVLRGIEGVRMKESYRLLATQYGIIWNGRKYDRSNPEAADLPNQAINHASTTVEAAAFIAVAATSTIPQLGFIHEDASIAFVLDIADLFRVEFTIPIAFQAVQIIQKNPSLPIEQQVRRIASKMFYEKKLIHKMIESIKKVIEENI